MSWHLFHTKNWRLSRSREGPRVDYHKIELSAVSKHFNSEKKRLGSFKEQESYWSPVNWKEELNPPLSWQTIHYERNRSYSGTYSGVDEHNQPSWPMVYLDISVYSAPKLMCNHLFAGWPVRVRRCYSFHCVDCCFACLPFCLHVQSFCICDTDPKPPNLCLFSCSNQIGAKFWEVSILQTATMDHQAWFLRFSVSKHEGFRCWSSIFDSAGHLRRARCSCWRCLHWWKRSAAGPHQCVL